MRSEISEGLGVSLVMALPVLVVIAVAAGYVDLVGFFGPVGSFGSILGLASALIASSALRDEPFALPACLAVGGLLPGVLLQGQITNHPEILAVAFGMAALGPALVAIGGDLGRRESFLVLPLAGCAAGILTSLQPVARIDQLAQQIAPAAAALFAISIAGTWASRIKDQSSAATLVIRCLAFALAGLAGYAAYETWIYVASSRQVVY